MYLFVSTMTAAPPLSALVMMISSLLNSSLTASLSALSRFGYGCLGLKILIDSISFYTASTNVSMV